MTKSKTNKSNMPAVKSKSELAKPVIPGRGFEEGVDSDDLIIPRAKLTQQMSPEVTEDDMKSGLIINSLTKEHLPETFIPIFKFKNFIRFNPRKKEDVGFDPDFEPGAIIWRSNDPLDERVQKETKFGDNGEKPLALMFLNFMAYFPGVPMPVIISFSKTSYRAGKDLLSLSKFSGGDMFSRKYKLEAKKVSNGSDTYFILKVAAAGLADKDDIVVAEKWWEDYSMKAKDIKVHDENGDIDPETGEKRPY